MRSITDESGLPFDNHMLVHDVFLSAISAHGFQVQKHASTQKNSVTNPVGHGLVVTVEPPWRKIFYFCKEGWEGAITQNFFFVLPCSNLCPVYDLDILEMDLRQLIFLLLECSLARSSLEPLPPLLPFPVAIRVATVLVTLAPAR